MSQQPNYIWTDSFKAATIHLFFSLLVAGALALLLFKVWYPVPLASATGMFTIFAIVFAVNLISGPLLTFVVYKKNKKSLIFDLTVIFIIQVAALAYGVYSLAQARPIWLTFYDNRFELVRGNDIESVYLKGVNKEYTQPSLTGVQWVAAKPVGSLTEIEDLKLWNRIGAKIAYRPDFYYPIGNAYPQIKAKAHELSSLKSANNDVEISRQISTYPEAVGWLPLWAQKQHMVVLINKEGIPIAVVDLRPWTKKQMNTVVTTST